MTQTTSTAATAQSRHLDRQGGFENIDFRSIVEHDQSAL